MYLLLWVVDRRNRDTSCHSVTTSCFSAPIMTLQRAVYVPTLSTAIYTSTLPKICPAYKYCTGFSENWLLVILFCLSQLTLLMKVLKLLMKILRVYLFYELKADYWKCRHGYNIFIMFKVQLYSWLVEKLYLPLFVCLFSYNFIFMWRGWKVIFP